MKRIPLPKGKYALVDDEDYEWLNDLYGWALRSTNHIYLVKRLDKRAVLQIPIANLILTAAGKYVPQGHIIDHINGDPLDNQKINLRICTQQQNLQNSAKHVRNRFSKTHSPYKGVSRISGCKTFSSCIASIQIGSFDNDRHAALAYDLWAKDLYGEFARTNFPIVAHS